MGDTGSNLVDMGRRAARDLRRRAGVNSEAGLGNRWGGHVEGLRRRRGDAVGVELGASLTDRWRSERGNHPWSPFLSDGQSDGGRVRCRLRAVGWGGGSVVCAGRRRELAGESPVGPAPSGVRSRRRG